MGTSVYLVGPKGANKANSYEHMTNSLEEAKRLLPQGGEMKVVQVKPRRSRS